MHSEFTSAVSYEHSIINFHCFSVSQRNYKRMNSIFFTFYDELSPYQCDISCLGCSSNPKFKASILRRVHDELFGFVVIMSLSFKVFGVTTMSNLGESKTSKILRGKSSPDKIFMRFKPSPCKRYDSFSVQHESNIASDTERR